jgi:rubrerythrin
MKSLKGTQTLENLMKGFAGESQARNRYTMYSKIASDEGYEQISEVFKLTAENERAHAQVFFNHLNDGLQGEEFPYNVDIQGGYPVGIGTTVENLQYAAKGEHEEHSDVYPSFAKVAEEEGFKAIAASFKMIGDIEAHHEHRFSELANNVQNKSVFKRDEKEEWICRICGYIHTGESAPKICPVCKATEAYFEIFNEKY